MKNRFLTASALPHNFDSHSRRARSLCSPAPLQNSPPDCFAVSAASRQWSLAPDQNSEEPPCKNPDSSSCFGIFDPIRRQEVPNTPEERVRQALLAQMLGPLGFPRGLLAVEKKLGRLCPEQAGRRIDIVAFTKEREGLRPLLLIECKAKDEKMVFQQAFGYNASLIAPFWALAHARGVQTFWMEEAVLRSVPFLPPYEQLVKRL